MANSAAALEIIRSHVSEHGDKLQLSQVLSGGSNEIAGLGVDKVTAVRVNVPVRDISGSSPEGARNKLSPEVFSRARSLAAQFC